jgi:uncharacterized membrane protein
MPDADRSRGQNARWSDEQVDQLIGNLLRVGVMVAAIVAAIGGAMYLTQHGNQLADYREFRGEPSELRSVRGIVRSTLALHSPAIVQLGLLLLIATPVARVAFSLVAFLLQRDRVYVIVTSVVLALLLFSLTGGWAG